MSKKTILLIVGLLLTFTYFIYIQYYKINQEKLFQSYQEYLNEESLNSQKKFGSLNKNIKVNLKLLSVSDCLKNNDEQICHVETQVENFRGLEKEYLTMTIKEENQNYKITKIKAEVKE